MTRAWPSLLLLSLSCGPDIVASSGETGSELPFDPAVECVEIVDVQTASGLVDQTCVLASNGATRCWGDLRWGDERWGPLHGQVVGDDEPAYMAGWVDLRLSSLSVGWDVCGATTGGVVRCLENWALTDEVVANGYDFGTDVVDVSVGTSAACAVLADGAVRCWGSNHVGVVVGDDEPPSLIELPAGAVQVSVGAYSTCAVLETGELACWGEDPCDPACGLLGVPGAEPHTPNLVELPGAAVEVSVGGVWACARLEDGTVSCWGYAEVTGHGADAENIGDDETPASVPVLDFGQPVRAIDKQCVLLEDGTVRCWGIARTATPLDPDAEPVLDALAAPPVPLPEPVTTISLGWGYYACALGQSGAVYCWGTTPHGVQGYGHDDVIGLDPSVTVVQPVPVLDPRCDER